MRALFAVFVVFVVVFTAHPSKSAEKAQISFPDWLKELRIEALSKGISKTTLDAALTGLKPIPRVIELDRRQPEFTWTFRKYMNKMVNDQRIKKAKKKLSENKALLEEIGHKYGIQPRFIVAFWGLETDFGRLSKGYFPTIAALATLAHDGRRSKFFRTQLIAALKILDQGHITSKLMKGSWAGAMGHFQFIPTTFAAYAQDYDGDGKRDIWRNKKDAYASAANFLTKSGWKKDQTWGREVKLPKDFNFNLSTMKTKKPLRAWQAMGIRRLDGTNLPQNNMQASVLVPAGASGPAFLIYKNFRTIMAWNRSIFYGIGIGTLADRMVGLPAISTFGPLEDQGLSFKQSVRLQKQLIKFGFLKGNADGIIGSMTREGIRNFQSKTGLTPDGYPSHALLKRLEKGL